MLRLACVPASGLLVVAVYLSVKFTQQMARHKVILRPSCRSACGPLVSICVYVSPVCLILSTSNCIITGLVMKHTPRDILSSCGQLVGLLEDFLS